jgi:hypothetical protein
MSAAAALRVRNLIKTSEFQCLEDPGIQLLGERREDSNRGGSGGGTERSDDFID